MLTRIRWTAAAFFSVLGVVSSAAADFPAWAYPACPPPVPTADSVAAAAASARELQVPGSSVRVTREQIRNWSLAVDWFPSEHSPAPTIVASSHTPGQAACGFCHLPDGSGRPENAKVAGLPAAYIISQIRALHARTRRAALAGWAPSQFMVEATADLSDAEMTAAADYFSRQPVKSFVRIEPTDYVPAHAAACFILSPVEGPAMPLGLSIVEMPADMLRFEARDPHTPYIAYVPKGSVERGGDLAEHGGGDRTQPCTVCHGLGLRGGPSLPGPPLAGRFPTYLFRQLFGFQSGARGGTASEPMRAVVARLTQADMVDLAAYVASLDPHAQATTANSRN